MPELIGAGSQLENVSRETADKIRAFVDLVLKWTPRINLISRASTPHIWDRHIADSLQIVPLANQKEGLWVDFGSGGGFPGVLVAILRDPDLGPVELVEADTRKAAFLMTAKRELSLEMTVTNARIEALDPRKAQVISARALAPLDPLLALTSPHQGVDCVSLFPKGREYRKEISAAERRWNFDVEIVPSAVDKDSVILKTGEYSRVTST